jgi:integrase
MIKGFNVSEENQKSIDEWIEDDREPNKNISKETLRHDKYCLRKFGDFLGDKDIKTATEKDLKEFFKAIKNFSAYNQVATKIIIFYRWIDKSDKREMPKRMKWFEFEKPKEKDTAKIKEELITPKEYDKIINACGIDRFGMWQACYETFYLSGGRLSEVASMKIKDVRLKDGKCIVYLPESKTKTREVPLTKYPYHLERWFNNHPNKDNSDSPLWISTANNHWREPIKPDSISISFWKLKKKIDIKQNLSIKSFRATRATIMFNKRAKDGGLIYTDKQMALFFGWELANVSIRRKQYDLSGYEDLKNTVFNQNPTPSDDYDIIKQENKILKQKNDEIDQLKEKIDKLKSPEEIDEQVKIRIKSMKQKIIEDIKNDLKAMRLVVPEFTIVDKNFIEKKPDE